MNIKLVFALGLVAISKLIHAQNVNPFTGSFNYGQNVLYVPSNRGVGVDINVSYQAGIQVNQPASEIGLGWSIGAGGAIYRSVSGIPDDTKSFKVNNYHNTGGASSGWGSLYPNTYSGCDRSDFYNTNRGLDSSEFTMADFDNFSVVGPGFGGQMTLSYHKYYSYNYLHPEIVPPDFSYYSNNSVSFKKPQFHFLGDFADTLVSRHYSTTITGTTTSYREPTDAVIGNGYTTSSNVSFIGKHLNGSTITSENFDTATTRLGTSNFVEYFTNAEIDAANSLGFPSGDLMNFVDYQSSSHARPSATFPADGIGYFRITGSNGLTYHYSLPVYHLGTTIYRQPLNNDYSTVTLSTGDFNGNDRTYHPSNGNVLIKDSTANKYAIKWLLTAITGADYLDSNNDHMVNDGDKGYWISYDYKLWSSSFIERSPRYGYDYQYSPDDTTKDLPQYFPFVPSLGAYKVSSLFGVSQVSRSQVYHLNKIRTSSHTALFIRDIRDDEKGMSHYVTVPANFKPSPDLALKRIVLFKNEQLDSILNVMYPSGPTGTAFNSANYPLFNFATVTNTLPNVYTESWFNTNFPNSNPNITSYSGNNYNFLILKNVFFDQDYSLCKGYHGNVNVNYNNSSVLTSPNTVETNVANSLYSNSGKLTLNKIFTYELANLKVTPSIVFDYDKNQALFNNSNPDYNPKKADYWGYYKSDATYNSYSRYVTQSSQANTKAWSLRRITDHLGGVTEIEYESNSYVKVLDHESLSGFRGASYIYRIRDVKKNSSASLYNIYLEEGSGSSNILSELSTLCSNSISNIKKRISLPYVNNIPISTTGISTLSYKVFAFGNITTTLTNIPSGSGNNLTGTLTPIYSTASTRFAESSITITPPLYSRKFKYNGSQNLQLDSIYTVGGMAAYTGNGFVLFETPIGYEVYGGGIRVKTISSKNTLNESYVKEYTYTDGVATDEADRFEYPRLKTRCAPPSVTDTPVPRYDYLQPKEYSRLGMSPMIGYSKVTIKDLGRVNTANGRIEVSYITDPTYQDSAFMKNNSIKTVTYAVVSSKLKTINECTNIFGNVFGAEKETKVFDINGNMISRVVNTYTPSQQGALTELAHFFDSNWLNLSIVSNTVNIIRSVPVVLKHSISYGMGGVYEKTETIARDELTGETVASRGSAKNSSTSYSFKTPAYKYYGITVSGLEYKSADLRKMIPLSHDMYSYGNIDSTLSGTLANGSSKSFLSSSYKLYTRLVKQRLYNPAVYTNSQVTLPYYYSNRSFVFDGEPNSIDSLGLLKKAMLGSNGLPLSAITNSVYWEPASTNNWRMINEVTLLDNYKHVVETRDINNRFSACKYGYNGYYKNSSVSNCNYASYTFADFETAPITTTAAASLDGDLIFNNPTLINNTTLAPHSGLKCIQISGTPITYTVKTEKSPGNSLDVGFLPGRIYRASVWVHNTNLNKANLSVTLTGSVNGVYTSNTYTANSTSTIAVMGNWNCIQLDVVVAPTFTTGTADLVTFSLKSIDGSTVYFDDFVMHPVESAFSGSVYNPRNGRLMSSIDGNGLATNYKYDAAGRMLEVWKEVPGVGYKLVKSYSYNYARGLNN